LKKLLVLVGTFLGSVVVCFVLLWGFIISRFSLDKSGIKIGDIMPYVVIFSFVLAAILLIRVLVEDRKGKESKMKKKVKRSKK